MAGFKVIVVGGGIVGLVLANALQAVGIDYVLTEQRSTIPPQRAFGIFLWPHSVRILHQLGLLEALEKFSQQMKGTVHRSGSGKLLQTDEVYKLLGLNHGYPVMMFDRGDFARVLEEGLRDRELHVKVGKQLVNIMQDADGVTAEFADGTSERGSIIVGADGVWSTTRSLLQAQAPKGLFEDLPFAATYRGMFGRATRPEGITPSHILHVHAGINELQVFSTETQSYFITYEKIERVSEKTHLRETDASSVAEPWLDTHMENGVLFRSLWNQVDLAGTCNFDEGLINAWHWDRAVLVGDAVHKMLPSHGSGASVGIEGAISLVNHLTTLLKRKPQPNRKDIYKAFENYQAERQGPSYRYVNNGHIRQDSSTSIDGPQFGAIAFVDRQIPPLLADGVILESVPFPNERTGMMPWKRKAGRAVETRL